MPPLPPLALEKIEIQSKIDLFLVSFFGTVFGMPFFVYFSNLGSILAHILASFLHHFPYFLHAFFQHRFCIDFVSIFDAFLGAQNHVLYCKTNSFGHFRLFRKNMKNHKSRNPFWYNFGSVFLYFSILFRHRFLDAIFSIFGRKWSPT